MSGTSWKIWLLAARPKTLFAGIAPVILGTAFAVDGGGFHALAAFFALSGAVLIQVGTNFANDYFDFSKGIDTADRLGPVRVTQAGMVTPAQMRRATAFVFALAFVSGLYLIYRGGWPILLIGVLSILFGVLYTGGPYPLAYIGVADFFVLMFFGPVAVAGTHYVQALTFSPEAAIAGLGPGLLSTAILTVNNLRDIDGDRQSGKKTLAARFGRGFARAEYVVCLFGAAVAVPVALFTLDGRWGVFSVLLTLLTALPALRSVFREQGGALNATLAATGKLTLLYCVLLSIGWLL